MFEKKNEVIIQAAGLERSNLVEFDRLEPHWLNYVAAVISREMTAMELISTSEALQQLATDLILALLQTSSACDNCGQEESCGLMSENVMPEETALKGEVLFASNSNGKSTDVAALWISKIN